MIVLFDGRRLELAFLVVIFNQVVNDGAGFPKSDVCVRVMDCRDTVSQSIDNSCNGNQYQELVYKGLVLAFLRESPSPFCVQGQADFAWMVSLKQNWYEPAIWVNL